MARRTRRKSSPVGLKTTKWTPAAGARASGRARWRAPGERVVERVEVGALRDGGALRGRRVPSAADDVPLEARGRLDRAGVPDAAVALVAAAHRGDRLDVGGRCLTVRLAARTSSPGRNIASTRSGRSKLRYHALRFSKRCERCMWVPPTKYAVGELRVAQGLEVRDLAPGRAPASDRRGEPEKELRLAGMSSAPGIPAAHRHRLRQARTREPSADEAAADARDIEKAGRAVEEARLRVVDRGEAVAAKQHGDVVLLEDRRRGVAREQLGVLENADLAPRCGQARRSTGIVRRACAGTKRRKYGRPQATVT